MHKIEHPLIICPGFIKSGTTLLYELFRRSPLIGLPESKELHYFSFALERDRSKLAHLRKGASAAARLQTDRQYCAQFRGGRRFLCDISPSYLGWPGFEERVLQRVELPLMIVLRRNRLQRALSAWHHATRVGLETEGFADAVHRDYAKRDPYEYPLRKYFQLSDYDGHIARLQAVFGTDRVLSIQVDGPAGTAGIVRSVEGWLGVNLGIPADIQINASEANKGVYLGRDQKFLRFIVQRQSLARPLSRMLPASEGLRRRLKDLVFKGKREDVAPTANDIKRVSDLFSKEFASSS